MLFADFYGRTLSALLDFVFPPRESDRILRELTLSQLRTLPSNEKPGEFSYLLPYRDTRVKALVWELKYRRNPKALELAGAVLSDELIGIGSEALGTPLLIPAPMSAARRRERGHNQTELLCEAVMKIYPDAFEYAPRALEKTRATLPQQGLPRAKRLQNMAGSMQADEKLVRGRFCIVVDDVATTGATFAECRRVLMEAGAEGVECVGVAGVE